MAVAKEAYRAGEVVEVPAHPVHGDDGGLDLAPGRLLVTIDVLAAGGDDQRQVTFRRGKGGGVPGGPGQAAAHRHEGGRVAVAVGGDLVCSRPAREDAAGGRSRRPPREGGTARPSRSSC